MSMKFVNNAVVMLLGGLVVVLSVGLQSPVAVRWSAFAIAIGIVGIAALGELDRRLGLVQHVLNLSVVATAGTLIAVTDYFGGTTLTWLAFALALGTVGIALVSLSLHEVETWRASHHLGGLHWLRPRGAIEVPKEEGISGPRAA